MWPFKRKSRSPDCTIVRVRLLRGRVLVNCACEREFHACRLPDSTCGRPNATQEEGDGDRSIALSG